MAATPLQELFDACFVLFGPETTVSEEYLKYLRPSGLKSAYRKIALETHPDRALALGKRSSELNERFTEVSLAYHKLNTAIKADGILLADPPPDYRASDVSETPPKKKKRRRKHADHYFTGTRPQRHLLFGQFLFYSGLVSWKTYIKALLWQRRQRPLLGQIAMNWGMLTLTDIREILAARKLGEKFGESAVRQGYLKAYNLLALLGKQRRLQSLFGEYFLQNGWLTDRQIELLLKMQQRHNHQVLRAKWQQQAPC
ncbi:MAG: J domain-containing protein [Desulfobacterales bacterium]|nr:J domain-containing protein [Desulfobacterales bacterium]